MNFRPMLRGKSHAFLKRLSDGFLLAVARSRFLKHTTSYSGFSFAYLLSYVKGRCCRFFAQYFV
jgi:hypothetical protein